MASQTPPPLIRSSKAFSVEIPEGSNSAKARRSEVVANDELDISSKSLHLHAAQLDQEKFAAVHEETSGLHGGGFSEDHQLPSPLQHLDTPPDHDHLAKVPDDVHGGETPNTVIEADAFKDNFAGDQAGRSLANNPFSEASDAIRDNLQNIAQDALHDNLQGVAQASAENNLQVIDSQAIQDNKASIGQDALHDNHAGIDNPGIQDNKASIGQEALHDNHAGIDNASIKDNQQAIASSGLDDHHQGLANQAIRDNAVGVAKEAEATHRVGMGQEHLQDHIVALPSSSTLTERSAGLASTDAHHALSPSATPKTLTSQALQKAQIEKDKKLEAFHGRVEAIRKTVSGINHNLDALSNEDPSKR